MIGKVDLHTHTKCSDGAYSVEELLKKAEEAGLSAISITDHDNVDGVRKAFECHESCNLEIISGIEVSCYENGREYHLLGYFIDIDEPALKFHIQNARNARFKRAKNIIEKLKTLKVNLKMEDVMEKAGEAPIARPHIANAMTERGYTVSNKQAFYLYLGDGRPAYEPKWNFPVEEGIKLVNKAGGLASLAHPGPYLSQDALYKIIDRGLDAIEVVHPVHSEMWQRHYKHIAEQYWLLETGGSDFHGGRELDEENFGKYYIPYTWLEALRKRKI